MERVIFTWSGGKDSAMALYKLREARNYEIAILLTTVTEEFDRVSMHGVKSALLQQQAESLGFTIEKICIKKNSSNADFEAKMRDKLMYYRDQGITTVAFGDIFLEDLKRHREQNLRRIGMKGLFPVWKRDTARLAHEFMDLGFKAVVTCVDSKILSKDFVGRDFDKQFLSQLPSDVDPCGENGEFHSFVYDGPLFHKCIAYVKGEIVLRNGRFYYCDLLSAPSKIKRY